MTRQLLLTPAILAVVITMTAGPALAQSGERERRPRERAPRSAESAGRDAGSDRSGREYAVRRTEPRPDEGRGASQSQNTNRGYDTRRDNDRRADTRRDNDRRADDRRADTRRDNDRRADDRRADTRRADTRRDNDRRDDDWRVNARGSSSRNDDRRNDGRYDNRRYDNRRNDDRRYDDWRRSSRGYGWDAGYDRSSWRSRIRFALGISIFAGRPVAFHFDYYRWRPPFTYHYPVRAGVAYGGMSFLLDPDWAEVYIDGGFAGVARDFGGQPVPVAAGFHRIELYAPGFEPVAFDVNVLPGQVIPYRGSLYRAY